MKNGARQVIEIIKSYFPNGLRDDFIDTNKILLIYSANFPKEKISRNLIADVIRANGIEDNGKFYFISDEDVKKIKCLFNEILEKNFVVYYSAVYDRYSDFFTHLHIFSPKVLKKILQAIDKTYFYFSDFCSANNMVRLEYEVAKIFSAEKISLSLDDLKKKLPYVPKEKLLAILSDTKKYFPTINGKFIPFAKIKFDFEEIQAAKQQIIFNISKKGYALTGDYNLSSNFSINPEIDSRNLSRLIFEKFFSINFIKQGRKIFKKDNVTKIKSSKNALEILREFIAAKDELTVGELFSVVESLNLDVHGVALNAAYEKMIRVSKNLFVKDTLVNFDVAGVDEALTPFVLGKIIPLRAVTSFTGFPPVEGYSWNLFLLESFLRKYSRKYIYSALSPNSSSMGAIYPKTMQFEDYISVQASVVLQENVSLEKSAVGNFLVKQGYRANRIDKTTFRIMERAREIRFI